MDITDKMRGALPLYQFFKTYFVYHTYNFWLCVCDSVKYVLYVRRFTVYISHDGIFQFDL